jgi:hypothetical protein
MRAKFTSALFPSLREIMKWHSSKYIVDLRTLRYDLNIT